MELEVTQLTSFLYIHMQGYSKESTQTTMSIEYQRCKGFALLEAEYHLHLKALGVGDSYANRLTLHFSQVIVATRACLMEGSHPSAPGLQINNYWLMISCDNLLSLSPVNISQLPHPQSTRSTVPVLWKDQGPSLLRVGGPLWQMHINDVQMY